MDSKRSGKLSKKRYPCVHCDEVCSSNFNLDRHVARRHPGCLPEVMRKKRKSSNVPLSFVLPQSIGTVRRSSADGVDSNEEGELAFEPTPPKRRSHLCTECMLVCGSKFNLERHRRRRHGIKQRGQHDEENQLDASANVCDASNAALKDIVQSSASFQDMLHGVHSSRSVRKKFPCAYCTEVCTTRFNLNRHINRLHPEFKQDDDEKRNVFCYLCTYSTCRLAQLCKHVEEKHNLPMNRIEWSVEGAEQFNSLITCLRTRFSGSLIPGPSKNGIRTAWVFRCNYNTPIAQQSGKKPRRSPCTFYLNIRRVGNMYEFSGCGSHFGHEVLSLDFFDIRPPIDEPQYVYGSGDEADRASITLGHVTYMHESDELSVLDMVSNMVNNYEEESEESPSMIAQRSHVVMEKVVHSYSQPSSAACSAEVVVRPVPNMALGEEFVDKCGGGQHADAYIHFVNETRHPDSLMDPAWDIYQERMAQPGVTHDYVAKLCHLEKNGEDLFRSNFLISPTGRGDNAYGGLLFAQSLQAALETVDAAKFSPHSIHSFFILNVSTKSHVDYRVSRVRDGRSYSTRSVQAEQGGKAVFISQVSFCVKEPTSIQHQIEMPKVPQPEELVDNIDFCREKLRQHAKGEIVLPKVVEMDMTHRVDGAEDNIFEFRSCSPNKYFALEKFGVEPICVWIRCTVPLGDCRDLHRFLVAYITDATLVNVANKPHVSQGYVPSMLFSLDHTVRFHEDEYRADEWLLYENWSPWAKNGRAFSEGRLWTRHGRLILTAGQESLSRTRDGKSSL